MNIHNFSELSLENGIRVINEILQSAPNSSGVYLMKNSDNDIIYIGKAKNLFNRLSSYKNLANLSNRIRNMIALISDIDIRRTNNEPQALILESSLIKQYLPKFNILLKDDKSYPYILITKDHEFPRITKHRGPQTIKGKYFGPFASANSVNQAIDLLQKTFLLRPCSDSYFNNRTRPCMEYQIKRCSAPCVNKISQQDYANQTDQLIKVLSGKTRIVQDELLKEMSLASNNMDYERAAIFRDRIKSLNHIQTKQSVTLNNIKDCDIIGINRDNNYACIEVCFLRNGQNFGTNSFFFNDIEEQEDKEIIENFLSQFYCQHFPPSLILIPTQIDNLNLITDALDKLHNKKVAIEAPIRGEKKDIVDNLNQTAATSLRKYSIKQLKQVHILKSLSETFNLPSIVSRIEIYDNSHISGTDRIGVMVVADRNGFRKDQYRKFNIKSSNSSLEDDYAMLSEVLDRRINNLLTKYPQKILGAWPNLMLIDGGAGHLSTAIQILDKYNLLDQISLVCIAKGKDRNAGKERFFMPNRAEFTLPRTSPLMHYLQVLRDEAHRFAITSHRNKRIKNTTSSILNKIPGIGKKRKTDLLKHFGSVQALADASKNDICKVNGINQKTAEIIYQFFRENY